MEEIVINLTYKTGRQFLLGQDIVITLSDGRVITLPKGFETDLSSIPGWAWSFFRPYDDGLIGDLVHDYLWSEQLTEIQHFGGTYAARKFADEERYRWRKALAPKSKFKNWFTHRLLRLVGGFFYSRQIKIPN